jgi:hypothetical protein
MSYRSNIFTILFSGCILVFWGCGETPIDVEATESVDEEGSFNSQLAGAGLHIGSYELEDEETTICTISFSFPGGQPVSEPVFLSGFSVFELGLNMDESGVTLQAGSTSFSLNMNASECLYFDRLLDDVWLEGVCPEEEMCPVFDTLEICSVGLGQLSFSPAVLDCGSRMFFYRLQEDGM